jgi:hypothetical protein
MCGCWNFAGTTPHHFCRYRGAAALVNEALFLQLSQVELAACATWALKWWDSRLTTLRSLDIKVDYRDALVWMDYQGPPGTLATGLDPK